MASGKLVVGWSSLTLCHLIRPAQYAVDLLLDVERCNSGMRRMPIVNVLE